MTPQEDFLETLDKKENICMNGIMQELLQGKEIADQEVQKMNDEQ